MAEEVKVGDRIPSVVLKEGQADYGTPKDVNISELIAGKKVAIFAVPGAFTPGEYWIWVEWRWSIDVNREKNAPFPNLLARFLHSHEPRVRLRHPHPRLLEVALAQLHDRAGRA